MRFLPTGIKFRFTLLNAGLAMKTVAVTEAACVTANVEMGTGHSTQSNSTSPKTPTRKIQELLQPLFRDHARKLVSEGAKYL
jgi:negative regulator of sigma E activity